jgi:hypothetical protein
VCNVTSRRFRVSIVAIVRQQCVIPCIVELPVAVYISEMPGVGVLHNNGSCGKFIMSPATVKRIKGFVRSAPYFFSILTTFGFSRQISVKYPNIAFHANPSSPCMESCSPYRSHCTGWAIVAADKACSTGQCLYPPSLGVPSCCKKSRRTCQHFKLCSFRVQGTQFSETCCGKWNQIAYTRSFVISGRNHILRSTALQH